MDKPRMEDLSPMMQQYMAVKNQHKDALVFFRLGDFYEMFFDDAVTASRELELTLTGRDCGLPERAPMCGVPYHSCEGYIARLIKKGYKVAICEQMENPATAKGMVRREVIRIVTPGTLIESNLLDEGAHNYIGSLYRGEGGFGAAFADISTGQVQVTQLEESEAALINELGRFDPKEVLFNQELLDCKETCAFLKEKLQCTADLLEEEDFAWEEAKKRCLAQFGAGSLEELGLEGKPLAVQCIGGLLRYLSRTQMAGLERLMSLELYGENQFMHLDLTARRNLEITETMRTREKRGSLLWVLDRTKTAMGKRLIRAWLEQPLVNPAAINNRQNAVEELFQNAILRADVIDQLAGVYDMERLMTRVVYGNASPRDIKALGGTLNQLPALRGLLEGVSSRLLREIYQEMDPLEPLAAKIAAALVDEPPVNGKEGGMIRPGYHQELDDLRTISGNTKEVIASIETREKEATGIKNLKIGYNRVFGYYIEVTKSYLDQVPPHYIRKQTLTGCERYITQELKELEEKVLTAQERMILLENQLFQQLCQEIASRLESIQTTAGAIARLDVLQSLAEVAVNGRYCRPDVDLSDELMIREGRHPVVEAMLSGVPFVPNDLLLNNRENQIAIITGPNMAGKSTYMRQAAIITLMAQIGSFVPAASARIGVVDGIYTRVGASDDLASGQSTFMVEMSEVASILKHATAKSLLILDEIGRGTSTYDGMSIARAVLEYIADKRKLGAKTLFATHYHELTALENQLASVKNYNIAVKKRGDDITFLRRIVPGGADDSYGIEVSKLAGIPDWIIRRAKQVLASLEKGDDVAEAKIAAPRRREEEEAQVSILDPRAGAVVDRLRQVDLNVTTPVEALNLLYELRQTLGQ